MPDSLDELRAAAEAQPGRVIQDDETKQRSYRTPTEPDWDINPDPPPLNVTNVVAVYAHPDGKEIVVYDDDTYRCTKAGKKATTSATPEKLRAGYGRWKLMD
jgi:hypothetical protein